MAQHTFKLASTGKEFPAKFGGVEVTYDYPENMEQLREFIRTHAPEGQEVNDELVDLILYNKAMGQGLHLDIQKSVKEALGEEATGEDKVARFIHAERPIEDAVGIAQTAINGFLFTMPGTKRGSGQGTKLARTEARAAQAEAKVDAAKSKLIAAYRMIPKNARAGFAEQLIADGVLTQEELDGLNQE